MVPIGEMYYLYYTLSILVHVEGILTATAMIWRKERYFFRIFLNYCFIAQFYPWPSIWRRSVHSILNSPFILYDIYPRFVYTPVLPLSRAQIFFFLNRNRTVRFLTKRTVFLICSYFCLPTSHCAKDNKSLYKGSVYMMSLWNVLFSEDTGSRKWIQDI